MGSLPSVVTKVATEESSRMNWKYLSMVCRKCEKVNETLGHLASGCEALAGKEYRRRHDRMGLRVYWEVCKLYGVECSEKWYEETPDEVRVSKDGKVEIWWDRKVVTMRSVECCRPDVTIVNRKTKEWTFVDFSIPWDRNVLVRRRSTNTLLCVVRSPNSTM